jgi:hypothetical protein
MDVASILRQIDAEITKLQRIREIVHGVAGSGRRSSSRKQRRLKPTVAQPSLPISVRELVILPPKQKREYSPRVKPIQIVSRALGPAPSDRPVFVSRATIASRFEQRSDSTEVHSLEALVRKNMLGGVA